MQPSPLAARQLSDVLLLIGSFEIEAAQIRARRHLEAAHRQNVLAARDRFPRGLVVGERLARLVDDRELYRRPDDDLAAVGLLLAADHLEERCLAGAVRPDDADDRAGRNRERQLVDQQPLAVAFAHIAKLDDRIAEPLGDRNENLLRLVALLMLVRRELIEARDPRLALRLTAARVLPHPFELFLHRLDARRFLLRFGREALLLLLEPRRIIAFPRNAVAAVELENP